MTMFTMFMMFAMFMMFMWIIWIIWLIWIWTTWQWMVWTWWMWMSSAWPMAFSLLMPRHNAFQSATTITVLIAAPTRISLLAAISRSIFIVQTTRSYWRCRIPRWSRRNNDWSRDRIWRWNWCRIWCR